MATAKKIEWTEFECPLCTAHNVYDDGFTYDDELFCSWCGAVILVRRIPDEVEHRYKLVLD